MAATEADRVDDVPQPENIESTKCPLCHTQFPDISQLNSHSCLNMFCYVCEARYTSAEELVTHLKLHDKNMMYFCAKCQETFSDGKVYSEHKMQCNVVCIVPVARKRRTRTVNYTKSNKTVTSKNDSDIESVNTSLLNSVLNTDSNKSVNTSLQNSVMNTDSVQNTSTCVVLGRRCDTSVAQNNISDSEQNICLQKNTSDSELQKSDSDSASPQKKRLIIHPIQLPRKVVLSVKNKIGTAYPERTFNHITTSPTGATKKTAGGSSISLTEILVRKNAVVTPTVKTDELGSNTQKDYVSTSPSMDFTGVKVLPKPNLISPNINVTQNTFSPPTIVKGNVQILPKPKTDSTIIAIKLTDPGDKNLQQKSEQTKMKLLMSSKPQRICAKNNVTQSQKTHSREGVRDRALVPKRLFGINDDTATITKSTNVVPDMNTTKTAPSIWKSPDSKKPNLSTPDIISTTSDKIQNLLVEQVVTLPDNSKRIVLLQTQGSLSSSSPPKLIKLNRIQKPVNAQVVIKKKRDVEGPTILAKGTKLNVPNNVAMGNQRSSYNNTQTSALQSQSVTQSGRQPQPAFNNIPHCNLKPDGSVDFQNLNILNTGNNTPQFGNQQFVHNPQVPMHTIGHYSHGVPSQMCNESYPNMSSQQFMLNPSNGAMFQNVGSWQNEQNPMFGIKQEPCIKEEVMAPGQQMIAKAQPIFNGQILQPNNVNTQQTFIQMAFQDVNGQLVPVQNFNAANVSRESAVMLKEESPDIVEIKEEEASKIEDKNESNSKSYYFCELCSQYFCEESVYTQHCSIHNRVQICTCSICDGTSPPDVLNIDNEADNIENETDNIDKETDNIQEETDSIQEETDSIQEETDSIQEETDSIQEETDSIQEETDSIQEDSKINQTELQNVETNVISLLDDDEPIQILNSGFQNVGPNNPQGNFQTVPFQNNQQFPFFQQPYGNVQQFSQIQNQYGNMQQYFPIQNQFVNMQQPMPNQYGNIQYYPQMTDQYGNIQQYSYPNHYGNVAYPPNHHNISIQEVDQKNIYTKEEYPQYQQNNEEEYQPQQEEYSNFQVGDSSYQKVDSSYQKDDTNYHDDEAIFEQEDIEIQEEFKKIQGQRLKMKTTVLETQSNVGCTTRRSKRTLSSYCRKKVSTNVSYSSYKTQSVTTTSSNKTLITNSSNDQKLGNSPDIWTGMKIRTEDESILPRNSKSLLKVSDDIEDEAKNIPNQNRSVRNNVQGPPNCNSGRNFKSLLKLKTDPVIEKIPKHIANKNFSVLKNPSNSSRNEEKSIMGNKNLSVTKSVQKPSVIDEIPQIMSNKNLSVTKIAQKSSVIEFPQIMANKNLFVTKIVQKPSVIDEIPQIMANKNISVKKIVQKPSVTAEISQIVANKNISVKKIVQKPSVADEIPQIVSNKNLSVTKVVQKPSMTDDIPQIVANRNLSVTKIVQKPSVTDDIPQIAANKNLSVTKIVQKSSVANDIPQVVAKKNLTVTKIVQEPSITPEKQKPLVFSIGKGVRVMSKVSSKVYNESNEKADPGLHRSTSLLRKAPSTTQPAAKRKAMEHIYRIRHYCDTCNEDFGEFAELVKHKVDCNGSKALSTHSAEKHSKLSVPKIRYRFNCEICMKTYARKDGLTQHLMSHSEMPYKCRYCSKRFTNRSQFVTHEKTNHKETDKGRTFRCDQCGAAFATKFALSRHRTRTCNPETLAKKPFVCELCCIRFVTKAQITHHMLKNHSKLFTCCTCGKQFITKKLIRKHIICAHSESFACEVCQKQYPHLEQLLTHERTLHSDDEALKHACQKCNEKFANLATLMHHKRSCDVASALPNETGSKCRENDRRTVHEKVNCNQENFQKQQYACSVRLERLPSRESVEHPAPQHTTETFTCKHCQKKFPNNASLQSHIEMHERFKFPCGICEEFFDSMRDLFAHESCHSDVVGCHKCGFCEKKFVRVPSLNYHMRHECVKAQDSKEHWYTCPLCYVNFSEKSALLDHKLYHCSKVKRH